MQFIVILRPQPDGSCQATVPAIPEVVASGASREEALSAAQCAIKEVFNGGEIATIDVPLDNAPRDRQGADESTELAVLLYTEADGTYRAKVPAIRGLVVTAATRDVALKAVAAAAAEARPGSEIAVIDVPPSLAGKPNPWLEMAGMFADDPTWDEFIAEMQAARAREDAHLRGDE